MRYASSGDVRIAYQTWGEGEHVVVGFPPFVTCCELAWEEPSWRRWLERRGTYSRVIDFDKRGSGLSDPTESAPTLEQRMDDAHAVMDAEGIERAVIWGMSEGGALALLFALSHPDRTEALVLANTGASGDPTVSPDDYEQYRRYMVRQFEKLVATWGRADGYFTDWFCPSRAADADFRRWSGRFQRFSCSPAMLRRYVEFQSFVDTSSIGEQLRNIAVPTLVIGHTGDRVLPVQATRRLAERIPGAKYVQYDVDDHFPAVSPMADEIHDEIEGFITGGRPSVVHSRVLATVLFSDLVDSTKEATRLGDRRWRELLDAHDTAARRVVSSHAGRFVKSTGDGVLATFDGPAKAIRAAHELREALGALGLGVRTGIHCSEVEVRGDDIGGVGVHVASRIQACAGPGEVLVSRTVKELAFGSDLCFADAGERELKGVDGSWQLFAATV